MNSVKTRSTYYTPAKVKAARENVQKYGWAAMERDKAVLYADQLLRKGLSYIWESVPGQNLPRSYQTNEFLGNLSPLSTAAPSDNPLNKLGNYPWQADPLNTPWKLTDPTTGYQFPTNDFGAYYRSGLNSKGEFDPVLADRSLLVNTLYPEKGKEWGVDDGYGWVDASSGYRYTFIAYYVHWFLWFGADNLVINGLSALSEAYLYTGEPRYGQAGVVLLDRIADIYPSLDVGQHDAAIFLNSHGGSGQGKAIGCIWETFLVRTLISSYDALFPALDDAETIEFLAEQARQHGLAPKNSAEQIALNIENGVLRQTYEGFKTAQIRGNNGFHQSALAFAAVVLDSEKETQEWLDYAFQSGGYKLNPHRVTGGNIWNTLINDVDRDGHGDEAAPGYNRLWLDTYLRVAEVLDGYDKYPSVDLFRNPKFRKMFHSVYPVTMVERYTAQIGDTGVTGNPGTTLKLAEAVLAFQKYKDPIFAQVVYLLNGNKTAGIHGDIFTDNPENVAEEIADVIREQGRFELPSANLTGYGFAALRDGKPPQSEEESGTLRDLWLYYGFNAGHGHRDTLNIGMHAYGLDLMPDLGYPEQASHVDMHRLEWVINVISHNTVVVDRQKSEVQLVSSPQHYESTDRVKLIDVEAPRVYPQTELYRRTTALIKVNEQHSYAVDFFRVRGGAEHHFSFHGPEGDVSTDGLVLLEQETGTYTGPDSVFGVRPKGEPGEGRIYNGPGFHWLRNVERAENPSPGFSADWNAKDTWNVLGRGAGASTDVHLRLTMLTELNEVAMADGVPPRNKPGNPASLRYLIAHREGHGAKSLSSTFTSVIEPYKGERYIESITAVSAAGLDGTPAPEHDIKAVKVQLSNGRIDYVICALNTEQTYLIDGRIEFQGFFGVYSEVGGVVEHRYIQDGTVLGTTGESAYADPAQLSGTVTGFTKELSLSNYIDVAMDLATLPPDRLIGVFIYIENDGERNAVYEIKGINELETGKYRLSIGDITLIRSYQDHSDPAHGYVYDITEGSVFRIPLSQQSSEV